LTMTMTMTLVRVPLTLAAAVAFHVSMSPPSPSDADTPDDRRTIYGAARLATAIVTKGLFWASALTDTLIMLAPYVPTSLSTRPHISIPPTETLLSWIRHPTQWGPGLCLPISLPLLFLPPLPLVAVAGTTLALAGAYLRYAAYNALGQFYACPNRGLGPCVTRGQPHARGHAHALITTGPYAFVRHPGYAGLVLCTTGLVVLQLDTLKAHGVGSWSGSGEVSVGMRTVALVCAILATVGALRRIRDEERALRARFKGEWEAWAGRVPYRLLPGVY